MQGMLCPWPARWEAHSPADICARMRPSAPWRQAGKAGSSTGVPARLRRVPQAPRGRFCAQADGGIGLRRSKKRTIIMATIGSVTKREDGRYEGELKTLTMRTDVSVVPVTDKVSPGQPDYRVISQGIEIGAGWVRRGQTSGRDYVSLSIAAPEFGAKTLYANLGRAAGNADPDVYALIWSPQD